MDLLARLAAIVGDRNIVAEPDETNASMREPRGQFVGRALAMVSPNTVGQVSDLLALCNAHGVGVVAQGGNTGLVGGQTPDSTGRQILLSLRRLDRVREIDAASNTLSAEAGVTLAAVQSAAEAAGRYFPLSLASEGSCTIGGNLATNAGGVHVIAYGSARALALGVEAVFADGRVYNGLSKLRKDNTGYDLTQLLIGSEGTLGVITAATLKLFPQPRARRTIFAAVVDPAQALALLHFCRAHGSLCAFELLPRIGVDFVLKHGNLPRDPFPHLSPWYVLAEFAGAEDAFGDSFVEAFAQAHERGLVGVATIAQSLAQRAELWRLRESMSEVQGKEGGSIKHDVSLPLKDVPAFIDEAGRRVTALIPGSRPVPFGHLGDGNIHYNVSQPVGADKATFMARRENVNEIVHAVVAKFGGSISAEHGVGQLKRDLLRRVKDPVALEAMRAIKAALDPKGILNPGKLL
jgi:FAD/FMN-containing dehydrogenase